MTMASGDDGSLEAPGPHGEDTGSPVAVAHDTVRPAPAHGTPGSAPSAPLRLLDIGTGTGCIAISAARALGHLSVVAVDIEPRAIDLASRNAIDLGVAGRIDFRTGDLFSSLDESDRGTFDVIASNPPYISDAEWSDVAPNVRDFEPERALRGGADGLDVIRRLLREAPQWLRSGGLLAIEIAASLGNAAQALASAQPELFDVRIARDHEGLDRVLLARRR